MTVRYTYIPTLSLWIFTTTLLVTVNGMEVYLRELTIYASHESRQFPNDPEVYLTCDDGRHSVQLPSVKKLGRPYKFSREQIPATHVDEEVCVVCKLMEADFFTSDDKFGEMRVCEEAFHTGLSQVKVANEFTAVFDCPLCKLKYQMRQSNQARVTTHAEVRVNSDRDNEKTSRKDGLSTGFVVMSSLFVFSMGVVVGVGALKFSQRHDQQREAQNHSELHTLQTLADVPYDPLPSSQKDKTTTETIIRGPNTFTRLPSDDTEQV